MDWISVISCNIHVLLEELKGWSEISRWLTSQDIRKAQKNDPVISRVLELKHKQLYLKHKDKIKEPEAEMTAEKVATPTCWWGGHLAKKNNDQNQLVIPESLKNIVYKHLHQYMAHLTADRIVTAACAHFFWPKMRRVRILPHKSVSIFQTK